LGLKHLGVELAGVGPLLETAQAQLRGRWGLLLYKNAIWGRNSRWGLLEAPTKGRFKPLLDPGGGFNSEMAAQRIKERGGRHATAFKIETVSGKQRLHVTVTPKRTQVSVWVQSKTCSSFLWCHGGERRVRVKLGPYLGRGKPK
jgi:hypothetical protein